MVEANTEKLDEEEVILKRLEKGRPLEERPASLATALPHRTGMRDDNTKDLQGKKETVTIASIAIKMDDACISECRRLKAISRRDENVFQTSVQF